MTTPQTLCNHQGNTCPSRDHCQRHTAPRSAESVAAALNARREAGASACDMFVSSLPSTFDAKPFRASLETVCTYPKCNCPFDAPADPNWCARGLPHNASFSRGPSGQSAGSDS